MLLKPPLPPMEARSVEEIPTGERVAVRAEMGWVSLSRVSRW